MRWEQCCTNVEFPLTVSAYLEYCIFAQYIRSYLYNYTMSCTFGTIYVYKSYHHYKHVIKCLSPSVLISNLCSLSDLRAFTDVERDV